MRVTQVTVRNFFGYEQGTFNLPADGMTAVVGSNGHGKSTLLDAIVFALYDTFIRQWVSVADIVRRGSKGGTSVAVTIEDDGHTYVVTRYRDHKKHKNAVHLTVDGESRTQGTTTLTNSEIIRTIGVPLRLFLSTAVITTATDRNLYTASDQHRKELLDDIFDLTWIARAHARALSASRLAAESQVQAEIEKSRAEGALQNATEAMESIVTPSPQRIARQQRKLDAKIERLETKLEMARNKVKSATRRSARESKADVAEYTSRLAIWQQEKDSMTARLADCSTRLAVAERAYESVQREVEALTRDKVCAACKRPFPKTESGSVLKDAKVRLRLAAYDADKYDIEHRMLLKQQKGLSPKPVMDHSVTAQERNIAKLSQRVEKLERVLRRVQRKRDRLDDSIKAAIKTLKQATKAVEAAKATVETQTKEYRRAGVRWRRVEFATRALGPQGIRSYLLDGLVGDVNAHACRFASRLFGVPSRIKLSPVTKLKTTDEVRDKLSIVVDIPGFAGSYGGLSQGQRARANLALPLAIREVSRNRLARRFDQLFIDEAVDGVDDAGKQIVAELLADIAKDTPVVLMTHASGVRIHAKYLIKVRHTGKVCSVQ